MSEFAPGLNWQTIAAMLGLAFGATLLFALLRRLLGWLLGPIFTFEITRLAHKGHTFWLRIAFATMLLGVLYASRPQLRGYKYEFDRNMIAAATHDISDEFEKYHSLHHELAVSGWRMARFAHRFSEIFVRVLVIAVLLFAPFYFATAITEEKEKRNLDLLLSTQLTDRQIVLGKLTSRMLNLGGVLLSGVPILALTQVWGGVDWRLILLGFGLAGLAIFSSGTIALFCSVLFARSRTAVIAAYAYYSFFFVGWWIFRFGYTIIDYFLYPLPLYVPDGSAIPFAAALIIALLVSPICLWLSIRIFRSRAIRQATVAQRVMSRTRDERSAVPHPLTIILNPAIRGDPLIWKERFIGRTFGGNCLGTALWYYLYAFLIIIPACAIALPHRLIFFALFLATLILGIVTIVTVALRLADSVGREFEQSTLETLLTLPISHVDILASKWCGTLMRARRAWLGLGLCFGVMLHFPEFN